MVTMVILQSSIDHGELVFFFFQEAGEKSWHAIRVSSQWGARAL